MLSIIFSLTGCERDQVAKPNVEIPKIILDFTTDKDEDVSYIRTKHYDGSTFKEFDDKTYKYEIDKENRLQTIFIKKETAKAQSPSLLDEEKEPISREDIILKSEEVIKRLNKDKDYYEIEVDYNEDKKKIKTTARQFEDAGFNGNNIYMQYLEDGTLISVSFKYEELGILNMESNISLEEARDIVITTFSTNTTTEKYAEKLDPENISHEIDVYNGKKVYNFYFRLPLEEGRLFDFKYIVSTDTGIILYRDEP